MKLSLGPIALFVLVEIVACKVAKVKYYGLVACNVEVESSSKVECTENEETGEFDVHIEIDRDFSGGLEYDTMVHKWDVATNDWEYDAYEVNGVIRNGIERFLPTGWSRLTDASDPPIDDKYFLPAGTYDMKKVKFVNSDLKVPAGMDGRFRVDFNILDLDDESVFCVGIELDISDNY